MHFDTLRVGQRDQDVEHAQVEKLGLEFVTECEDGNCGRHFRLHTERDLQDQVLAFLDGTRLEDELLVAVRACGQVSEGRDGMALDLFIVGRAQKIHQGFEEACVDDRRFVERMDRDVANTGDGREYQRKIGGLQESEEGRKTSSANNLELVLFIGSKITQGQRRLALHLGGGGVHEVDQGLHQSRLGLGQTFSIGRIDGYVAEASCAVVLHVNIRRRK